MALVSSIMVRMMADSMINMHIRMLIVVLIPFHRSECRGGRGMFEYRWRLAPAGISELGATW